MTLGGAPTRPLAKVITPWGINKALKTFPLYGELI